MKKLVDLTGKKIVIAGASSGIGESVTRLLGDLGAQCVLIARREERLEKIVSGIAGGVQHTQILCF